MKTTIRKVAKIPDKVALVLLINKESKLKGTGFTKEELSFIQSRIKKDKRTIAVNQYKRWVFVQIINKKNLPYHTLEECRKDGCKLLGSINSYGISKITVVDADGEGAAVLALTEGLALANYQFLKYFKDAKKKSNSLTQIDVFSKAVSSKDVSDLQIVLNAVYTARDLVNEPVSFLNAMQLSKEIQKLGKEAGFKVEVFNKSKIKALKMGGLLAVNKGSLDPPTFTVLEWKPKKAKNKKPYILVGKGIVYDTGGLSLKPTPNSMDEMKSDMAGAAATACAIYAIAKAKLPVHIIGLIPATDNRPDGNAYAPGDVIKMFNGTSVEVLNTDAEGRMVLADALSYAQKYKPELVIDLATLTGAAQRAIGGEGIVSMGTAPEKVHDALKESGCNVFERLVEFPLWEEYETYIESAIADIKNTGGANAGMITAGKFLEHFTKRSDGKQAYPWLHLDIAGTAFLNKQDHYRSKGATGAGVRLLFDFFKNKA